MIKEQTILLTTNEKGVAERRSRKINGKLLGVLLVGSNQFGIEIKINNTDIVLYEKIDYDGKERYLAPRVISTSSFKSTNYGATRNDDAVCYALNDKLFITINGKQNTMIKLILRWGD